MLQGYNSTFTILSGKNTQSITSNENEKTKSSLPDDTNVASNELDDEIPF